MIIYPYEFVAISYMAVYIKSKIIFQLKINLKLKK
jgi:hypothetical protein